MEDAAIIDWTRYRLKRWGRWCQGGERQGLPSMAAFARANTGGRAAFEAIHMPADIEEIDGVVASLATEFKIDLITVYCRAGPMWWKAAKLGTTIKRLRTRIRRAEQAVTVELDYRARQV